MGPLSYDDDDDDNDSDNVNDDEKEFIDDIRSGKRFLYLSTRGNSEQFVKTFVIITSYGYIKTHKDVSYYISI